jgi:hypothetical protein
MRSVTPHDRQVNAVSTSCGRRSPLPPRHCAPNTSTATSRSLRRAPRRIAAGREPTTWGLPEDRPARRVRGFEHPTSLVARVCRAGWRDPGRHRDRRHPSRPRRRSTRRTRQDRGHWIRLDRGGWSRPVAFTRLFTLVNAPLVEPPGSTRRTRTSPIVTTEWLWTRVTQGGIVPARDPGVFEWQKTRRRRPKRRRWSGTG